MTEQHRNVSIYRRDLAWHIVWSFPLSNKFDDRFAEYLGESLNMRFRSFSSVGEFTLGHRLVDDNGELLMLVVERILEPRKFIMRCYAESVVKSKRAAELEREARLALEIYPTLAATRLELIGQLTNLQFSKAATEPYSFHTRVKIRGQSLIPLLNVDLREDKLTLWAHVVNEPPVPLAVRFDGVDGKLVPLTFDIKKNGLSATIENFGTIKPTSVQLIVNPAP